MPRIKEFILSKDSQVRSAVVELPDKHFIARPLNHLFLEIPLTINNDNVNQECVKETSVDEVVDNGNVRSIRGAAPQA